MQVICNYLLLQSNLSNTDCMIIHHKAHYKHFCVLCCRGLNNVITAFTSCPVVIMLTVQGSQDDNVDTALRV